MILAIMKIYDHKSIEQKWKKYWDEQKTYSVKNSTDTSNNYYLLVEFPYPSGNLHVGHWYAFAVTDIFARFKRMSGKNVLYPIGFDAFGLPAENAAIKRGINPRSWTEQNIEYMTEQIKSMGASFDWSRTIKTIDPDYYKWTQWMFVRFFESGLAEQKKVPANWCPSCKTVLANEQVVNGTCERCDSEVDKKDLNQWTLKITKYADRLIDDLDELDWAEDIKEAQRQWIGRSEGVLVRFPVSNDQITEIEVFTTRPDTIFGATYMVLAPEHELVAKWIEEGLIENVAEVENYIKEAKKKSEIDRTNADKAKTGVELKGIKAVNPAYKKAGMDEFEIPVFIADYVLANYGTGAIMAVPAHDERDFEFATKYDLPIVEVILGGKVSDSAYTGEGSLANSSHFDGIHNQEAKAKITKWLDAKPTKTYRLRDWVVSRQRYWGVPIPVVHCEKCGAVPEKEENLPILLPDVEDYLPNDDGQSPLAKVDSFVNTTCPKCGNPAKRETDTLDTFVDSSWFFLRYIDPENDSEFSSDKSQSMWMPVDFYSGGAEHTTMHLLYSRFWQKALYDLGLAKHKEPYKRRPNRGLILGADGNKMSKSKGNVVDPDKVVEQVGSDAVRGYLAFIGPYNEPGNYPWNPDGVISIRKFLERAYGLKDKISDEKNDDIDKLLHKTIKKVREDAERLKFNTAISAMMVFVKTAEKQGITTSQFSQFTRLLAPFAPYLSEEIWQTILNNSESVHIQPYPDFDMDLTKDETITIGVQINGKRKAEIEIPTNADEKTAMEIAMNNKTIQSHIGDLKIKKVVYVPGRILNIIP